MQTIASLQGEGFVQGLDATAQRLTRSKLYPVSTNFDDPGALVFINLAGLSIGKPTMLI